MWQIVAEIRKGAVLIAASILAARKIAEMRSLSEMIAPQLLER